MRILGIDPGLKGGIALIMNEDALQSTQVRALPMPLTEDGIVDSRAIVEVSGAFLKGSPRVFLEVVHAMPKQGVTSMFTFGKGYGQLIGMCQVMGWEITFVRPQLWQKTLRGKYAFIPVDKWTKDISVMLCENVYPEVSLLPSSRCTKPSDGMADALCIAHYGRLCLGDKV